MTEENPQPVRSQRELDINRAKRNRYQKRWRERKRLADKLKTEGQPILQLSPDFLPKPEEEEIILRPVFPQGFPSKGQSDFLELLRSRRFVLLRAGRQYGKSTAGFRAIAERIYQNPVKCGVGWIVCPTYPMAEQLRYKMEEVLAPFIVDKREGNTPVYFLEPPNGWPRPYRVEIKTAEKPDRLRGPTLDWMWLDEARNMDRAIWPIILPTVAVSRGPIFATTTPAGKDWVYEKFIVPTDAQDPNFGYIVAKSSDACHFTDEDIRIMRSQMSEEMAKQELDAEIVAFDGLVYPGFNTDINVIDPLDQLPEGSQVIGGVDFGWKDPFVHIWVAKTNGVYVVFDEYYRSGQFIEDHASSIKANRFNSRVQRRWADPSSPQFSAELDYRGISSYPANNDVKLGVDCVRRLLDQRRIFVTRNCKDVIREFGQYHYPETKEKNTKDVPHDSFNHAMDALRYVVYNEESVQPQNPYGYTSDDGSLKMFDVPKGRESQWMSIDDLRAVEGFIDEDANL